MFNPQIFYSIFLSFLRDQTKSKKMQIKRVTLITYSDKLS